MGTILASVPSAAAAARGDAAGIASAESTYWNSATGAWQSSQQGQNAAAADYDRTATSASANRALSARQADDTYIATMANEVHQYVTTVIEAQHDVTVAVANIDHDLALDLLSLTGSAAAARTAAANDARDDANNSANAAIAAAQRRYVIREARASGKWMISQAQGNLAYVQAMAAGGPSCLLATWCLREASR